QQNGGGDAEGEGDVGIAFAEAPAEAARVLRGHGAGGNIPACEKFRKQSPDPANLCGAWEYDVVTLPGTMTPNPSPVPRPPSPSPSGDVELLERLAAEQQDRKSTRLNSSHPT